MNIFSFLLKKIKQKLFNSPLYTVRAIVNLPKTTSNKLILNNGIVAIDNTIKEPCTDTSNIGTRKSYKSIKEVKKI